MLRFFEPTRHALCFFSCSSQDQLSAPWRTAGPSFAASRRGSGSLLRSATPRVSIFQVFIYFTKVEKGSGKLELRIVQKLSSILQGSITAPLNSDSAWLYFVYTTTAVAVQMRRAMAPT